ncbi:MAG: hypothetical protein OXH75_14275 [Acidobacteria bacterium]|nr:hypothetical protein [Acidobacteriota bacterium]
MSLRSIHLVFIAASILLAVFTTVWGILMFMSERGVAGHLAFAVISFVAVAGMSVYAVRFVRKTRAIGMR